MSKITSFIAIGVLWMMIACISLITSEEAIAISLPAGIWTINASGQKGELNIATVGSDGQITGTLRWGIGTPNEYTNKIFGFWDADAWKITFLRQTEITWKDPNHTPIPNTGHGRDQIFTGYMFGGLPCASPNDPGCTSTGTPITIAGSYEAFGGTQGTGATANRNVFGWIATK